MMTYFFKPSNLNSWLPKLQCHRGYHVAGLQENSLAGIQKAFELGFGMVEFDVRLTNDQVVVLNHDPVISEHIIAETNFTELKKVRDITKLDDLFSWFASQPNKNLKLNIELKSRSVFLPKLEEATCELIKKFNLSDRVMFSSFNPFSLMWVRFYLPQVFRGLLVTYKNEPGNHWLIKKMFFNFLAGPHGLNLRIEDWNSSRFSNLGKKVPIVLWTCNDFEVYKKLKDEIHGIISDEITPDKMNFIT
jgi:glycerophosphoryl diester phosphodiesterase